MKIPKTKKLNIPSILKLSSQFEMKGKLTVSNNNLVYLDIDDDFIHQLFPLLTIQGVKKPDYFGEKSAGAHITVIYPEEENFKIEKADLGKEHEFIIKKLISAEIGQKNYYILLVESPTLLQLRRNYHLPDLLCFKGYSIGFHITIGVRVIPRKA